MHTYMHWVSVSFGFLSRSYEARYAQRNIRMTTLQIVGECDVISSILDVGERADSRERLTIVESSKRSSESSETKPLKSPTECFS